MSLSCINEAHCILLSKLYYYYNYAHYLRLHLICQLMDWKESKAKLISEVFVAIHACITIRKSHRRFWFVSILITLISNDHNSLFYPVTFSSAHCVKMNEKDTQTHTVAAEWCPECLDFSKVKIAHQFAGISLYDNEVPKAQYFILCRINTMSHYLLLAVQMWLNRSKLSAAETQFWLAAINSWEVKWQLCMKSDIFGPLHHRISKLTDMAYATSDSD